MYHLAELLFTGMNAQWIDFVPGIQLWPIDVPDILMSLTGNDLLNINANI